MTKGDEYWGRAQAGRSDAWSGGGAAFRNWMRQGSRRRSRTWLVVGAVTVAALGLTFASPLALAGTSDSCTAFETALLQRTTRDVAWAGQQRRWPAPLGTPDLRSRSGGSVGRRIAAMEHGSLPAPAGCTALYWQVQASRLVR